MLVPWSVTHKFSLLSTASPTGKLNCSGRIKVLKVFEVILYRRISPFGPGANMETHAMFFFLSTATEPVLIRLGSTPLNPLEGIGIFVTPFEVPFFSWVMFPNHSTDECVPTKYMFPFESKSKDTGEIVPNIRDVPGTLYISRPPTELLYLQIAFCFWSVNHTSPFISTLTDHTSEK